ncbi:DUF2170 family protein [Parendozoicomonas haliclonae]
MLGLVKKEVWIYPEHSAYIKTIENNLKATRSAAAIMNGQNQWTASSLLDALLEHCQSPDEDMQVSAIDGSECLSVVMPEQGDLELFISVSGEQILVETFLFPEEAVSDKAALNAEILRTHKLFPLSTISVERLENGQEFYAAFGALSSSSLFNSILTEIEMLAINAINMTEAYGSYLTVAAKEPALA